ncbi:hypothetical protein T06_9745 [Trichinella sp. T6]|nr:hypothetical protein T06_9745 [Trichinella sp. T6]
MQFLNQNFFFTIFIFHINETITIVCQQGKTRSTCPILIDFDFISSSELACIFANIFNSLRTILVASSGLKKNSINTQQTGQRHRRLRVCV